MWAFHQAAASYCCHTVLASRQMSAKWRLSVQDTAAVQCSRPQLPCAPHSQAVGGSRKLHPSYPNSPTSACLPKHSPGHSCVVRPAVGCRCRQQHSRLLPQLPCAPPSASQAQLCHSAARAWPQCLGRRLSRVWGLEERTCPAVQAYTTKTKAKQQRPPPSTELTQGALQRSAMQCNEVCQVHSSGDMSRQTPATAGPAAELAGAATRQYLVAPTVKSLSNFSRSAGFCSADTLKSTCTATSEQGTNNRGVRLQRHCSLCCCDVCVGLC